MEFMTQEDRPRSLVHLEEGFDGDPQLTGHLSGVIHGHVEDRFRDKPKNPTADTIVCLLLGRVNGVNGRNRTVEGPENAEFAAHGTEIC
jgi:hypothetical protein